MTWQEKIEVGAAVVTAASLVCTVANAAIRGAAEQGIALPRWVLVIASALNAVALNGDKSIQLARGYRGASLPPGSRP
jgi:hypothetical protein